MADNSEAFNNLKKEIRSILIPHQNGCSLHQFRKDYKQMLGRSIPYNNFNYYDDLQLLKSIPDTVRVWQSGGDYQLMAVADESTKHIQKMVAKQKPPKHKPSKNRYPPRYTTYTSRPASRPASFSNYSSPYAAKQSSHANYATTPVQSMPSANQFVRAKPSYASQSAQFDNNPFTRQPVPAVSVPSYDSQPALVPSKPVSIVRQSVSNNSSFHLSNPPVTSETIARKPTASTTAASGWVGQRQSDVPPRFRAPVTNNILPPDVECSIVNLVRKFATGIRLSDFPMAYRNFSKEMFSWQSHGFDTLKQCLDNIPDLVLTPLKNDYVICYKENSSAKPNSIQQTVEKQLPDKLVDFNFASEPSSASVKSKAAEVFQFTASWKSPTASSEHRNQKSDVQSFNQETESYNLKSNSPWNDKLQHYQANESYNLKSNSSFDEKSQYYQDSDVYKKVSSQEGTPKKKADVLDSFELSSGSSFGITDKIKNNMREIMSRNKQGILATDFPAVYEDVTGFRFDLHTLGFNDLTDLVDALPDIFRRRRAGGSRKDWIIVPPAEEEVRGTCSPKNRTLLIECSIQNIRKILQGFPEGIQLSEFLNVYSTNLKEPLYILDLGFSCIDDFLLSISDLVPLKIELVDGFKSVFLAETEEVAPPTEEIPTAVASSLPVYVEEESIPFDAASPDCEYKLLQLPADFDRSLFVPVYTSTIIHPGHLYVQLEGEETTEALERMYEDIDDFYYGPYSYQYQMKRPHLKERAMCAALWPQKKRDRSHGDNKWYRALIIDHNQDFAKVFYVDYGTTDDVPLNMLRYLKVAFAKLPAQAVKARLAHLKPPNNAPRFSSKAQKRMLQLCIDIRLMAKVEEEKDGILSLILCNTNGETDLYINDILLEEGFAVSINEPNSPPTQQQLMQVQCYWQMVNSLSLTLSPEEMASTMQQLSLNYKDNPLVQQASLQFLQSIPNIPPPSATPSSSPPADESEIFQDDDDLFEDFIQKASSVSKRYVKRVRSSDGYFFHVLIVDGEAFVSSGDVSMLIWNDKSPQYLLARLQTRDIILSSRCISDKGNEAMFHQFEKFHVKGTQNNGDYSSIIIYSLKSVIPLLNMYGHPSVELRHKILMEIESFNPQLPAWQEVSEVEMTEDDMVFQAVTDDDKLKRLCIYDLIAMKEGIRQKRNTLVRNLENDKHDECTVDELDKLEGLLQRVVVGIEQIRQICVTFS